jgi:hypothetical protein
MRAKSKEQKAAEVEEAAAAKLRQEEEARQDNERKMLARCIKVRPATLRGLRRHVAAARACGVGLRHFTWPSCTVLAVSRRLWQLRARQIKSRQVEEEWARKRGQVEERCAKMLAAMDERAEAELKHIAEDERRTRLPPVKLRSHTRDSVVIGRKLARAQEYQQARARPRPDVPRKCPRALFVLIGHAVSLTPY